MTPLARLPRRYKVAKSSSLRNAYATRESKRAHTSATPVAGTTVPAPVPPNRALERHCRANEYKVSDDTPLPPRTRLVVFALSVFGSLGGEAAAFVHWLHKRQSGKLPPTLLEAASWACPKLGPIVRQAVGVAVRRGLARAVNATHVHVPPPPPPAAPVAVRPRLTPWMDAALAGGVVVRELQ